MVSPMQLTLFLTLFYIRRSSSEKIPFAADVLSLHGKTATPPNRTQILNESHRSSRCDVAGIVAKFQSRGRERSDDIAQRLMPLAQEMVEYAKLHNDIINSWKTAAPVGH
jgi:hypothetical protein